MAKVTVRVKMDRAFMVYCEGKNAEEAIEDICDKRIQAPELAEACYEVMEVEEGTYDEDGKDDKTSDSLFSDEEWSRVDLGDRNE